MRFSVITVCKNNLAGLKETYTSVFAQTYENLEWIVVDGNSSDGTKEWLKGLNHLNCKWVSAEDSGIFEAMNKGMMIAEGEYVIFLNGSDSLADSEVLMRVNLAIKENPQALFMYGDSVDITAKGKSFYRKAKPYSAIQYCLFTQHQAMIFKTDKLEGLFYNQQLVDSADYAFVSEFLNMRVSEPEREIVKLEFAVCKYLLGGLNEQNRFRALKQDFFIRRNILKQRIPVAIGLFIVHFFHTFLKKFLPQFMFRLRYRKTRKRCNL
jgi:putative colanic acid biosynthesis glycosyltransferase